MIKNFTSTYIFLCTCLIMISCEMSDIIDINKIPGHEQKIKPTVFVQGIITSKLDYQTVKLSSSFDIGEIPDTISGAIVEVIIDDSIYPYIESIYHSEYPKELQKKGVYVSINKIAGKVGKINTLHITYKDIEYFASDSMIRVNNFEFKGSNIPKTGYAGSEKRLDFGGIHFAQDESYLLEWKYFEFWGYDNLNGITYKQNSTFGYFFTDLTSPDISSESESYLTDRPYEPSIDSLITATKYSISNNYKTYLIQTMKESLWNNSFFSSIPANTITNVTNGGLGYFAACDIISNQISYNDLFKIAIK